MPGSLTADQQTILDAILRVCAEFGDDYWLARDRDGEFPDAFKQAMVDGGWLGLTMPTEYGGAGLGLTEGAVMLWAIAESGERKRTRLNRHKCTARMQAS